MHPDVAEIARDPEVASEMSVMFEYSSTEPAGQSAPPKKVKKDKAGYELTIFNKIATQGTH